MRFNKPNIARFFVALLALYGCQEAPTRLPATATPTQAPATAWVELGDGIELQPIAPNGNRLAEMVTLRINPRLVRFEAHYRPNAPLSLQGWRETLPDALAFVNANFFAPEYVVLGLLISDGTTYGQAYTERGGTFFEDKSGNVGILENVRQALPTQSWRTAVQAFPMLVYDGLPTYANARDARGSRRTVVGIDNEGRVLLMTTPGIGLGLYPLSQFLPTAELGIQRAFNLDGGRSTMLWIQKTGYGIASFEPVPSVLALYRRADAP